MIARFVSLLALIFSILASPCAQAQSLKPGEVFSSVAVRALSEPNPVPGADGRVHLAFELLIENPTKLFVVIDKVEILDAGGQALYAQEGDPLAAVMQAYGSTGRMLSPGGTAVIFLDVSLAPNAAMQAHVAPRITATRHAAGPDNKPAPLPPDTPVPATFTFDGHAVTIGKPAVVVEPPLRGTGWVAVNGCCDTITSHRGAVMAINGALRVPERFAIDWVKLDANGKIFVGDGAKLESFAYYGTPIHAAADGVVVNLYDEAEEQVPNVAQPKGITTDNIGGNMLVVDIGGGAFAFYAHMQRGSLRVKLGDRVKAGQVIGLLGNTGNSTAPHLHFHVMDGPSPLNANGLPFAFTRFNSQGVLAAGNDDEVEQGGAAKIEPRWTGRHTNQLPLNNQVVDFD